MPEKDSIFMKTSSRALGILTQLHSETAQAMYAYTVGRQQEANEMALSNAILAERLVSSLFFSFLFIKLTRFADLSPGGRCPVPVNLILDEFNNIGRIGGAPDGSDFCRSLSVIRSRIFGSCLLSRALASFRTAIPTIFGPKSSATATSSLCSVVRMMSLRITYLTAAEKCASLWIPP